MTLMIEMKDYEKNEFLIRTRRYGTNGSKEVREMIKEWMNSHPEMPTTRMKPSVQ